MDLQLKCQSALWPKGRRNTGPDISIEVDDVTDAYKRMKMAKFEIEYDPTEEG